MSTGSTESVVAAIWTFQRGPFFTQVEGAHAELVIATEVSPDGIHWVQRGEPKVLAETSALVESPLTVFGNWIRLVIRGASPERPARILVHLTMKG